METIDDKVLQEGAIEDYLYFEGFIPDNIYGALDNKQEIVARQLMKYIKTKFNLSDGLIDNYKQRYKKQYKLFNEY